MRENFENELLSYISDKFTVCNDETLLSSDGVELKTYDIEGVAKYFYELGKNDK